MRNKKIPMEKFLKLRNRGFQTLVLGLLVFTFYTYYRATVRETRPMVAARTANRTLTLDLRNGSLNATLEAVPTQWSKNLSLDTPSASDSQRQINNPTILSAPASVVSIARDAASISTNGQSGSETNSTQQRSSSKVVGETVSSNIILNVSTTNATTIIPSVREDTAQAMYSSGHEVKASDKCPKNGTDMDLVILITSAPQHVEARTAIRQTWGHFGQRSDVAILFIIGLSNDEKLEKSLRYEVNLYGDVIRGRFIDSYTNLTLKTISSLEWTSRYCHRAKFMLKTDDDMFINVPRLLSFIHKHERDKNVIFGRLAKKWKPFRNKRSKYYVPTSQYKPPVFPDFTTGPAYLMSRDVVEKLFLTSLDQTYLKLEDVFTTGIVAQKLGVKRIHANEFINTKIPHNPCNVQRGISIHMVKYSEQFDLWKKLLDGKSKCKR